LTLWEDAEILVRDKQNVLGTERIYFNYGNELNNLGQHQEAISAFNKAIHATTDIDSAYAIKMDFAYANRAIAYRLLGKYQKALSDYNRAIEISPNDVDYYYWRAKLYRELGNYSGAINDIRESCRRGGKCR
jgi:tetratricopeptide (TPR) repeat protein